MHRGIFTSAVCANSTCSYMRGRTWGSHLYAGNSSCVLVFNLPDFHCFVSSGNAGWRYFSRVSPSRFSRAEH